MHPRLDLEASMTLNEIWDSFLHGIVVAVVLLIAGKAGGWLISTVRNILNARTEFGISGFWIGECSLPSHNSLEIWRYLMHGSHVRLTFFSYQPTGPDVDKWVGVGVFRGELLSAYYFKRHSGSYTTGVIALRLHGSGRLEGAYAQSDVEGSKEFYVSDTNYMQMRVTPPFLSRVRMFFGISPFRAYEKAKTLYEKAGGKAP